MVGVSPLQSYPYDSSESRGVMKSFGRKKKTAEGLWAYDGLLLVGRWAGYHHASGLHPVTQLPQPGGRIWRLGARQPCHPGSLLGIGYPCPPKRFPLSSGGP